MVQTQQLKNCRAIQANIIHIILTFATQCMYLRFLALFFFKQANMSNFLTNSDSFYSKKSRQMGTGIYGQRFALIPPFYLFFQIHELLSQTIKSFYLKTYMSSCMLYVHNSFVSLEWHYYYHYRFVCTYSVQSTIELIVLHMLHATLS